MISVGIDVSKGKSTVCILKPNEDFVCKPFELLHNKEDLELRSMPGTTTSGMLRQTREIL